MRVVYLLSGEQLTYLALHSVFIRLTSRPADTRTVDAHAAKHTVTALYVAIAPVTHKNARARAVIEGTVTHFACALPVRALAVVQNASAVEVSVAEVSELSFPAEVKVVARCVAKATTTCPVLTVAVVDGSAAVKVTRAGRVTNVTFRALIPIF